MSLISASSDSPFLPPSFFESIDLVSLKNLASIRETGFLCIDVDYNGHVSPPYAEGIGASLWRSSRWITGLSQNSEDLSNIKKLFDRTFLAYSMVHEDYSSLLKEALDGLKVLASKYRHVEGRHIVVKNLEEIEEYGIQVIKKIKLQKSMLLLRQEREPPKTQKEIRSKKAKSLELALAGKKNEREDVQSGSQNFNMGFFWYIQKFAAFGDVNKLSLEKQKILHECSRALKIGFKIFNTTDPNTYLEMTEKADANKMMKKKLESLLKKSFKECPNVGLVFPVSLSFGGKEDVIQGHTIVLGIRRKDDQIFLTQYNTGLGALGARRKQFDLGSVLYRLQQQSLPTILKGEAVVVFGPYNQEAVIDLMINAGELNTRCYPSPLDGAKAFVHLFDPKLYLPHGSPERRFQMTSNCTIASVREWLVDTFQRSKQVSLFNDFDAFGQTRDWSTPSLEKAKESGIDAEDLLKLKIKEADAEEGWEEIDFT